MRQIKLLSSDLDLELEFLDNIKHRVLGQKFLYQGEGAEKYYKCRKCGISKSGLNKSLFSLPEMKLLQGKKVALVYLFCNRDYLNLKMLDELNAKGYNIDFFGVDASISVIETFIADQPREIQTKHQFFWADFTSYYFRELRDTYLGDYDLRIYVLPDGVMGNLSQAYITDTLYNILEEGDLLWLDAVLRKGVQAEDDIEMFNYYAETLDKGPMMDFFFWPLRNLGINRDRGEMTLHMTKEDFNGAIKFRFDFAVGKKTAAMFRDERILFLPGETIRLLDVRVYEEGALKSFLREHDFELLRYQKEDVMGQFLLRKGNGCPGCINHTDK